MKYECTVGILLEGKRVRVGDVLDSEEFPLVEKKPKNFAPVSNAPKADKDQPMTISDIAKARQFSPAAKPKK